MMRAMPRRRGLLANLSVLATVAALMPALVAVAGPAGAAGPPVFINEIHYDNADTDIGEAVEIAGPAGTNLAGWTLVLYNGSNGAVYNTTALSGTIPNQQAGFGTLSFSYPTNGIQNGAPDGLALVDAGSVVVEFLSYEGSFVAVGGPANGVTSTDIGVSESSSTPIGDSLQRTGTGTMGGDFTWASSQPNTFGAVNTGQTFSGSPPAALVINEILQNPSAVSDAAGEWFEVVNLSASGVDIDGWTIQDNDIDSHVINNGGPLIVPAGGFLVLAANGGSGTNGGVTVDYVYGSGFFLANGADELVLLDEALTEIDRVEWDGGPAFPDPTGASMSLQDPSLDNNVGANWCTASTPFGDGDLGTPGAANDCPGPQPLVINEIDYDQPGVDTAEFVEIKNAGVDPVALTDWTLELVNGATGGIYDTIALPSVTLAAGDYFVVCGDAANVPECDLDVSPDTNLIQNGAPDAVGLRDGNGDLIDAVSYEGDTGAPYTEGSGAGLEDSGSTGNDFKGISRLPDGVDTNQNNVDLSTRCITPGLSNSAESTDCGPPAPGFGSCGDAATFIHDVQGSGLASPLVGNVVTVEGVVVGDFENTSTELSGFFLQEEDTDVDGDSLTSEGVFVFNNDFGPGVADGDVVRVQGTVAEFFDLTELNNVTNLVVCPGSPTATPAPWSLPVTSVDDWESVEGMEITINETLYASGNFNQARFGEVDLSVGAPLDNPTNVVAPGAPAIARQDLNDRSRIQMDDGSTVQNPLPLPPYIGAGGTLRTGDTIPGITAAVGFSFGSYELHPTQTVNFTRVNVRPGVPSVGGTLEVAAYNVLNYFTTLDDAGPICGPAGDQGCRGADNAFEFGRQRAKLVDAISQLDAEVVGLMEIENHPGDVPTADLVAGLNAATAPGTYDYIATGAIGSDAIRVALLYQPAAVTPVGAFDILDSSDNPLFDDTLNRPMLTQTFIENASGGVFTVSVNHLKSKGSPCDSVGDPDTGDGQGNCNITRTNAATAIVSHLAGDPTGSGDPDYLVIGDLNAYAQEDPVVALENGGYTDLIEAFVGTGWAAGAYSFNFFSQSGYLDHGMASPSILPQVTGAAFWHVNADEPRGLDYNDFNQPLLFNPDEFRSSDHDPVVIGLGLTPAKTLKETASLELSLLLPTSNKQDDKKIEKAITRIGQSLNPAWWVDSSTLDPKDGKHVFDREHQAVQELQKVATVDVQSAIDLILEADEQLALKQLTAAVLSGGDPADIAKAQSNFADAAANIANADYAKAVLDYKKAWMNAVKAL